MEYIKHILSELSLANVKFRTSNMSNITFLRILKLINAKHLYAEELPSLEFLTLDNPILINDFPRMKNLNKINIIMYEEYEEEIFVDCLTFPRLEYIDIFGSDEGNPIYTGNLDISFKYDPNSDNA